MGSQTWLLIALLPLGSVVAGEQTESPTMPDPRTREATALMMSFAQRTGLVSKRAPRRYLWTDAFAVCNLLGLTRLTGEQRYSELALALIDQVHHTLGVHRADDPRSGWISGLSGQAAETHPTRGGLRIGKPLPERGPQEPFDERLEWERDGQYFHYLTKWMHALDQVSRATGAPRFNRWARELATTAHAAFTYQPDPGRGARRMHWKMSIDLTRPLVPSMGQHDPLDGYITYLQLRTSAAGLPALLAGPELAEETEQAAAMLQANRWATADPLGLGGLLIDAYRVGQLMGPGAMPEERLLEALLSASLSGLRHYARSGELQQPAEYRLAFRELGLSIGLHAAARLRHDAEHHPEHYASRPGARAILRGVMRFVPLRDEIEAFWLDPAHRRTPTWSEHRDINEVMLATSLAPDGFLGLTPRD